MLLRPNFNWNSLTYGFEVFGGGGNEKEEKCLDLEPQGQNDYFEKYLGSYPKTNITFE